MARPVLLTLCQLDFADLTVSLWNELILYEMKPVRCPSVQVQMCPLVEVEYIKMFNSEKCSLGSIRPGLTQTLTLTLTLTLACLRPLIVSDIFKKIFLALISWKTGWIWIKLGRGIWNGKGLIP